MEYCTSFQDSISLESWKEGALTTNPTLIPTATRRTLPPRTAYALVAGVIGLALFASATPAPLYATYRELWGFSPVVLTLVYATYAFGVLAALTLAGRVSDEVGRRPVLLVALGTLMVATVVFMFAGSVMWLFIARAVQGLATGLALGAASAAMLDLHPRRDPAGVGLANGVVSAGGMGLGVLVSAAFIELLPAPLVLPYVALFVLFAIAFIGALRMAEPVASRSRLRLTPQRPGVPATARRAFLLASPNSPSGARSRGPEPPPGQWCSPPEGWSSSSGQRWTPVRSSSPARSLAAPALGWRSSARSASCPQPSRRSTAAR